ncbi:MAG: hypothetical protein PHI12_06640 [Dehalococcoidales bacterium]|nr:hypothetical protein [Dehalococcoidales bacterium]
MSDELVISVRKSRKGRPTPWLDGYREKFKVAAKEAAAELQDTELRGAARVIKFNSLVREKLKAPSQ